ncbi:15223_t:CDS:2, partial [Cetraspora pellucida]
MWNNTQSTKEWIESHVPQYTTSKLMPNSYINYDNLESIRRSYYYILSGACFTSTFDENITMSTIKFCLNVLSTSVSIVAIRKLYRQEVDTSSSSTISHSYGTHMVTSMLLLGFLFLGGGNFTLSTSNKAIAGLVCALFPRYSIEPYDNRAHLQAFRHLWVLAVEPRCLVLRDIEAREACHILVKLVFKDYYNAVKVIRDDDDNHPYEDHSERSQTLVESYYYNNETNTCSYQNQEPIQVILREIVVVFREATTEVAVTTYLLEKETNLVSVEIFKRREKDNPLEWIKTFDHAADTNNWSQKQKLKIVL